MTKIDLTLGDTELLIAEGRKAKLLRNQLANVLAQIRWETAGTMKPVLEYGGEGYLKGKPYYPYVGRGYIQLTWKANYEKAGKILGVDFVKYPRKLMEPGYSATIAVIGMRDGWFTGKRLSDYITLKHSDFFNARSIVNGDKTKTIKGTTMRIGQRIEDWSREYDRLLTEAGYGVDTAPAKAHNPGWFARLWAYFFGD